MAQIKHVTLVSGALETVKPIVVDTVSDLRGLAEQYPIVIVRGHTAAKDGGGGEFWLLGTSATPGDIDSSGDDDDGFHIVNAAGYIWQRQSDVVTPQMFGAFPAHTSTLARSASDLSAEFQRAVDFYLDPASFPGTDSAVTPKQTRRFEAPSGYYRCASTINFHFGTFGSQSSKGYSYGDYYVPGECLMRGYVWTPYSTNITAISLKQNFLPGQQKIHLQAVKDVISSGGADTTYAKQWATQTWPQIYFDDTCVRTWANGTKYYRDEDIKYVSSSITYIIRCTATGTTATATPTTDGTSFTSGGTFYCRGISRLANGQNMDDMLMDTLDVGIHVGSLSNAHDVTLAAMNYAIGVRVQAKEQAWISWSSLEVPRAPGCKVGLYVGSWLGDRIVELEGRTALSGLPSGAIVWETAYPFTESGAGGLGVYPGVKDWTSGGTGFLANDLVRYKLNYPTGWHQDGSANGQFWVWRVSSITTGILGSTAPTSAECTSSPWTSGGVTMVCIGSHFGTRYTYNGSTFSESAAAYQQRGTSGLGWVNDTTFRARLLVPRLQGEPSLAASTSTYGVVVTGPYANNNNHFDMVDHTPAQITTWTLCEAVEFLIYSGTQNTFHCRQENPTTTAAMMCQPRKPHQRPLGNIVRASGNADMYADPTYRKHRGGGGNLLLGPMGLEHVSARYDVDFSKSFTFSSYNRIYSRDVSFYVPDFASTVTLSDNIPAGLTSESATNTVRYFHDDDSWQFNMSYLPAVVVDLGNDVCGAYILRLTANLGAATYSSSDRWFRWLLTLLDEDGRTKIDPGLLADTTRGTGTYASIPLIGEIGNGIAVIPPVQTSGADYIYSQNPVGSSNTVMLAVHPLIKKFVFGLWGMHLRGWTLEVLGSNGAKIHPARSTVTSGLIYSDAIRSVAAVPEKGRIIAPSQFQFVDGLGSPQLAHFKKTNGQVYWCTSGNMTALTGGTNRMWGHDGASQGSATIKEWNGSTWATTVATSAYYATPTMFTITPRVDQFNYATPTDTTPSVYGMGTLAFNNTGSVSVNGLDDAVIGQRVTLYMDNNTTLVHAGTPSGSEMPFFLNKGSNYAGTAGVTLDFFCDGAYMREIKTTS